LSCRAFLGRFLHACLCDSIQNQHNTRLSQSAGGLPV